MTNDGGVQQVSAVVTREYSNWAIVPLPSNPAAIWLLPERILAQDECSDPFGHQ